MVGPIPANNDATPTDFGGGATPAQSYVNDVVNTISSVAMSVQAGKMTPSEAQSSIMQALHSAVGPVFKNQDDPRLTEFEGIASDITSETTTRHVVGKMMGLESTFLSYAVDGNLADPSQGAFWDPGLSTANAVRSKIHDIDIAIQTQGGDNVSESEIVNFIQQMATVSTKM